MDIYTRRAVYKVLGLIAMSCAVGAFTAALIDIIGLSAVGALFTLALLVYLCYHMVISDAEAQRSQARLKEME